MTVTTVNPVDTSTPGTYTITYDAQDQSGNTATQLTRTVNVVGSSGSASISGTLTQNNTLTAVLITPFKIQPLKCMNGDAVTVVGP